MDHARGPFSIYPRHGPITIGLVAIAHDRDKPQSTENYPQSYAFAPVHNNGEVEFMILTRFLINIKLI